MSTHSERTAPQRLSDATAVPRVAAVIVLAAGEGTRMKSRTSKILHEVAGESMISSALRAAAALEPQRLVVVVGHQRAQVEEHLAEVAPEATIAVQEQQNGTGDAVRVGLDALPADLSGDVVVTYGDVPMLSGATLQALVDTHNTQHNAATVLTANVDDPTGYGRVVRENHQVLRIVEHKDADPDELFITEINSGIYVFDADLLRRGLASLRTNNSQGELYLTDVIEYANRHHHAVGAYQTEDTWQTEGVNDRVQLARMNAEVNRRICEHWMLQGVTIADPATTWIQRDVTLEQDVTLLPGTQLLGATSIAAGATIGPDTTLKDVEVGEDAQVIRTHGELAVIGPRTNVGPWARLRPGTELAMGGKIGTFVETKNAKIGENSKVPHLTYCGDAIIGEDVNVGAGTVFANYDGKHKSTTHLGDDVFIGSNSVLVAPVDVADGAFVAAGSAIIDDVPAGALAVARGREHVSDSWVAARHPGSKADEAARNSTGDIHPAVQASRQALAADAAKNSSQDN
ncbi:bifunctional UDP-N-acetylglucosamine diphosphorylase/glucosamine-1-phosphate N-acetyltransferase GlmU [Propionibacterium freudenreichii]|uniref:bifunctional UDP-N-acetylglucosamine diphosphorylase/glucosamine-1-phosphate N-acetyltransferase GlmU n=1 Tax=Propionibacterium freudenreichii TaxID=1744 RepID=UPI002550AC9D|nr:bifunctional UDP-N-acetylglucosamine diphosphorylase/glucosamine-1-phosphate N-acetyltransferase GlmU [Propionibacterium freudenreichii]MDK9300852.1 bifunctional UDP-N-acetylglucosamine diphosphorylase/glucosamine-1-phosphate N-acetyltransferase GlmU [Propionibacterium freudenreichii]MDK9340541.1 bifunctional UDP-N-acetylglucosamine diphosphorylase/glucosamine-1-phosphate N-acetyltransferase GlmU [Propionibacterium freudenreichii]MDK9647774.1 bifunctional UDP-N-acetylglucosamine diphosphoryla